MRSATERNSDSAAIRTMFDRLAPRYDLFNRLASGGMDGLWRKRAVRDLRPGMRVLDLGCGTGDLAFEAARRVGASDAVFGLDFSEEMLAVARERASKLPRGGPKLLFVHGRAEDLLFETKPFDAIVSGFVLRNLRSVIDKALDGCRRSLKPGGIIRFLDITEPELALLRAAWRAYMNSVVALYGHALFGSKYPDRYLTESANRFPRAKEFAVKLERAGFKDVRARPLLFGIVTLYEAHA